jgi:hypothetical protein
MLPFSFSRICSFTPRSNEFANNPYIFTINSDFGPFEKPPETGGFKASFFGFN